MKRSKKIGKQVAPVVEPQETAADRRDRLDAEQRYRATESLKRPLQLGQCPHDDHNFCEYCTGGE